MSITHCDLDFIRSVPGLSTGALKQLLECESPGRRYERTKSLINLLYNLLIVQSLGQVPLHLRPTFERYEDVVGQLFGPRSSLREKKQLLLHNLPLVRAIADSTCSLLPQE